MSYKTEFLESLNLRHPIIQAPMAGGATTPELIAAVANQGGLGSLAAGYLSPAEIKLQIQNIRELTDNIFSVNLFVPEVHSASAQQIEQACFAINTCACDINANVSTIQAPYAPPFEEQIAVLIDSNIRVVSFTFGIPEKYIIRQLKNKNIFTMATATSIDEALAIQENNIDAIVVQGSEAGGHRGSFLTAAEDSLFPIEILIDNIIKKIDVPVIASGGIMTGHALKKCIKQGASAVQLGTAFLTCDESGIPDIYKNVLLNQTKDNTVLTRVFSGKLARGINNQFIDCMQNKMDTILDYPIQHALTSVMRTKAKAANNADSMSLWAGQNVHLTKKLSVERLFSLLLNG